jgi:rubrerythrin
MKKIIARKNAEGKTVYALQMDKVEWDKIGKDRKWFGKVAQAPQAGDVTWTCKTCSYYVSGPEGEVKKAFEAGCPNCGDKFINKE